ncbi:hypothetical protein F2P81_025557 [Scophthalmus maximus]|uniref:Uncharacterized protein n=1 Tax=Scophthalmus maximus TaxID=52904 RepID=A0A6A4RSJ5_SCOMX|nr:hypothetical protein F2P81_025557 [Scophthalmus maximus]
METAIMSSIDQAPSLQFVNDRENIRQYLRDLSEAKMKKTTQQNYLKSLKRVQTNLRNQDKECQHFIAFIGSLQRILAKHSKKEITQKRHSMLIDKNLLSTKNCLAVLEASKKEPWKDEMDGEERFFLSTAGRQIHSASNDLSCWRKVYERWEKRQLKLRQECVRFIILDVDGTLSIVSHPLYLLPFCVDRLNGHRQLQETCIQTLSALPIVS